MRAKENRIILLLFLIIPATIAIFLSSCSDGNPTVTDITKAPKTSAKPSHSAPISSSVTSPQSTAVTTEKTPTTSGTQTVIEFPLEISKTPSALWQNGENPYYDAVKKGFAVYFTSDYTYTFTSGALCTLEIERDDGSVATANGRVDLSVGNGKFMEEGIFVGVGFTADYVFEGGHSYNIKVKIRSESYTYTFSFDKRFE